MKANVYDLSGKKVKQIDLPKFFSEKVREDIVAKVIEAKKKKQPYSPSPVAGNQYSASGKLKHHRHVWKSQYGRGMSRVPRKSLSRKGSQFNWVGATVPNTRGGRRAHPPKVLSMINTNKINKKELKIALISALSATANGNLISKKYETLKDKKIGEVPFIIEIKKDKIKVKELNSAIKKIIGDLFSVAIKKKSVRAGRGKMRGRKYKTSAGLLMVIGKDEKIKTSSFEVVPVDKLSVVNLAKGGLGRMTIYTEKAIKELENKLK